MRLGILSLITAGCMSSTCLVAQPTNAAGLPELPTGTRVRVVARPFIGKFVGDFVRTDSRVIEMRIATTSSIIVPWSDVSEVAYSQGRDFSTRARRGALFGIVAAPLVQAIAERNPKRYDPSEADYTPFFSFPLVYVVVPALSALIGVATTPERWTRAAIPPRLGSEQSVVLQLSPIDQIRVRTPRGTLVGRASYSGDSLSIVSRNATSYFVWPDVTSLEIRAGKDRKRGAILGASFLTLVSAIGIATDPLPTTEENVAVVVVNALIGAAIGAYVAPKGWLSLPVPRR